MSEASDLRDQLRALFGSDKGRALTLRRVTPGAYDPATGDTAAATTVDYPGLGRLGTYRDALVNGTIIRENDRLVTFCPDDTSLVPAAEDRLIAGSDVYTVVNLKPRELAGEYICFSLQVRR